MRRAIRRQVALFTLVSFTGLLVALPAARADEATDSASGTQVAQATPRGSRRATRPTRG